jgi:hypothetical protein
VLASAELDQQVAVQTDHSSVVVERWSRSTSSTTAARGPERGLVGQPFFSGDLALIGSRHRGHGSAVAAAVRQRWWRHMLTVG